MDGQMTTTDISSADLQAMIDAATDGPWEANATHPSDGWNGWHIHQFVEDDYGFEVGDVHGSQDDPIRQANARLIAAAPDLAAEVINLRAANMALVAGQAKAYQQGLDDAAKAINEPIGVIVYDGWYRKDWPVTSHGHQKVREACHAAIAALSPRGQDHAG